MGSCQSTEATAVSKVAIEAPANNGTSPASGLQSAAKDKIAPKALPSTANTDPVDASHHSLESYGSQQSLRSDSRRTGGGKSGYSSGASSNDVESGAFSSGDDGSVGGSVGSAIDRRSTKSTRQSSSMIGLDSMIDSKRDKGSLQSNLVHMEVPFGKPIEEVYDGVHNGPVLGSGISGLVRLATHKATGVKYAVKCLDLGLVDTDEGLAQLREEIFIMCQLDHPNIVRLEEVYESHSEIYLVQELCLGGELFDRLDEQPDYHYTEAECARLVKQMLCAVRYLHSKGIIHRDLKLENFLFSSNAHDSELKMIDFGLSKHFRYGEVQHEAVGTPYTVAPEVIRGSYDERCDIWAIGVIAFLLLSGEPPFGGCGGPEPLMQVRSSILAGDYDFEPAEVWDLVSEGAKDFIEALLVTDPKSRPTARESQKQPWMREWADKNRTEGDNILNPNVVNALVNFKEFSDMRKLLCEVLSFTLLPEQIKELRKEFEKMDTDGSGEISLAALKEVLVTNAGSGSLGALTEEEVEDIFNAMRVKKSETRIHWHEFIAAGLSQCQVDDRNLRLAFDRLDSDHKGYVTLDDIMDLLGNEAHQDEDMMRKMWGDSMQAVNCNQAMITYSDFLLLMKGQTRETAELEAGEVQANSSLVGADLRVVVEEKEEDVANSTSKTIEMPSIVETENSSTQEPTVEPKVVAFDEEHGTPQTPTVSGPDAAEGLPLDDSDNGDAAIAQEPPLTPSGLNGLREDPSCAKVGVPDNSLAMSMPEVWEDVDGLGDLKPIAKPAPVVRIRSRSFDEAEPIASDSEGQDMEPATPTFSADARRALVLPATLPDQLDPSDDGNMTALQHNRQLYRAHRQMRLSVMEASKRFEEQQARHARDVLLAQQEENDDMNKGHAGLVMRRVQNKTVSTEAVMKLLEQNKREQQSLLEKANRRGGRGRRQRHKTISDIGGMLGSLTQDEMGKIASKARSKVPEGDVPSTIDMPASEPVETNLRGATVPGEFRKVNDPFGTRGMYGRLS